MRDLPRKDPSQYKLFMPIFYSEAGMYKKPPSQAPLQPRKGPLSPQPCGCHALLHNEAWASGGHRPLKSCGQTSPPAIPHHKRHLFSGCIQHLEFITGSTSSPHLLLREISAKV